MVTCPGEHAWKLAGISLSSGNAGSWTECQRCGAVEYTPGIREMEAARQDVLDNHHIEDESD